MSWDLGIGNQSASAASGSGSEGRRLLVSGQLSVVIGIVRMPEKTGKIRKISVKSVRNVPVEGEGGGEEGKNANANAKKLRNGGEPLF